MVLGTAFNVRANPDEGKTIVEVEEGSVLFRVNTTREESTLSANDKIVWEHSAESLSLNQKVEWKDTAWKAKKLSFSDEPLPHVFDYLRDNFGIEISYIRKDFIDCPLTATLVDNTASTILKQVESAFPSMRLVEINTNSYQLSGHCD